MGAGNLAPAGGHAVRSLAEPGNPAKTYENDHQVSHMSAYVEGGDVHTNSGIPNHAFYLAAVALGGNSWDKAGKIWYSALPLLKSDATFADAAKATTSVAGELFGSQEK